MVKLFIYGTLRRGHGNHSMLDGIARFLGNAVLKKHEKIHSNHLPYVIPTLRNGEVEGELYDVVGDIREIIRMERMAGYDMTSVSEYIVSSDIEGGNDDEVYAFIDKSREMDVDGNVNFVWERGTKPDIYKIVEEKADDIMGDLVENIEAHLESGLMRKPSDDEIDKAINIFFDT